MSWKKLIQVHKEIVRRGEDDFFILFEKTNSSRSSSIKSFSIDSFSGPWKTNIESLNNINFSKALQAHQHEQFFIGGPIFYKDGSSKLYPIIYKEVNLKTINNDQIIINPLQGKWFVSPPMMRAILKDDYIDDFDEWLKKKIEVFNNNKTFNVNEIVSSFIDDFPSLNDMFSFDEGIDNWFIFSPPTRVSSFNVHLMRDYEKLENSVSKSAGGLKIFKEQQKTKKTETQLLPLVKLNKDQEKAVNALLSENPLSVITGPPGTGKSQVVVSTLLNAWSQGKTVLFSSTNNAAVDVIKDRLDEFNAGFPLYVRGGAKTRNNIDHVLQQVLMFSQDDESFNIKDIASESKKLDAEVLELEELIESKRPQQITELYQSAESSYSECLKEKLKIAEKERYFQEQMTIYFDAPLGLPHLNSNTDLLNKWAEDFKREYKDFLEKNEDLTKIESKLLKEHQRANNILNSWNIKLKEINELEWIKYESPDNFKNLNNNLESYVNDLLLEEDSEMVMIDIDSRWEKLEEVDDSIRRMKKIRTSISKNITDYDNRYRKLKAAENQHKIIQGKCLEAGLKETIKIDKSYLSDWIKCWLTYKDTPKTILTKLPFGLGKAKVLLEKLKTIESSFKKEIPMKVWREIGELNDESREELAEYVELMEDLAEKQEKYYKEIEDYEEVKSNFQEFKKDSITAKISNKEIPKNINWDDLLSAVENNLKQANETKKVLIKISTALEIAKKIKLTTDSIFEIRTNQPIVKEWFKSSLGSQYESILNALNKSYNHDSAKKFKSFFDQKTLFKLLDSWIELIRIYEDFIPLYETKLSILKSPKFDKIMNKFPTSEINKPNLESFNDYDVFVEYHKEIISLNSEYSKFIETGKTNLISSSQNELNRALEQLKTAAKLLDKDSEIKMKNLITKIANAELKEWPQNELDNGFREFNEVSLKSKLKQKYKEIASLSFEKAKAKWYKKISTNNTLQDSISKLRRKLGSNKNIIPENSYKDFKDVLKAIPIWISTAQATQSIPMMPELFDIVIMDEASQCTMTHAIPLIYRGKTFGAIGDPNQLPAIPTLKNEEENSIVNSLNYDNYPDHLRHDNNNVYLASFFNLFQATKHQIFLSEHFRSHPLIIGFSNLNIYYEKYKKPLLIKDANKYSSQNDGISYVQVDGASIKPSSGGSWINSKEANAVVKVINDLKNNEKNKSIEIGVVSAYRKQVDLIIDMLTKSGLIAGVSVGTAHTYQGQERDIVIYSTVVSNGMDTNSALWQSKPPNLLNVAMTRARKQLIIVGDMDYCENNFSGDMLGKLAKYCKKIHKLSKISQEQKKLFELLILNGIEPEIEYPIADMHVDFCISASGQNLIIEVDGDQHFEQKEHDESRDASLRSLGFKVFRTSARDVRETPNVVINKILETIN